MQYAMRDGRKDDAADGDEGESAEESIGAGKEFGRIGLQLPHRAHAAEDHGGIQQGVDPTEFGDVMIPHHAEAQCNEGDDLSESDEAQQTPEKDVSSSEGSFAAFKHDGGRWAEDGLWRGESLQPLLRE